MKFRKLTALIMAAVLAMGLVACGGSGDSAEKTAEASTVASEGSQADEEELSSAEESEAADDETAEENTDSKPQGVKPSFDDSAVIEETVLYDKDDVKIIATGLEYSASSVSLMCSIENNSSENLGFSSNTLGYSCNAVNGYMITDGYINEDITAGNKANVEMEFNKNELLLRGITVIADIQVGFSIQDEDYDHVYTGPLQVKTGAAESYDYETDTYLAAVNEGVYETVLESKVEFFAEEEFYNSDGIRIISAGLVEKDESGGFVVEYVNDTDYVIYASTDHVGLNGLNVCDSTWSSQMLNPHCRAIYAFSIDDLLGKKTREMVGIDAVDQLSFYLSLKDEDFEEFSKAQPVTIANPKGNSGFSAKGTEVYNDNGLTISTIGLADDDYDWSDDKHIIMIAENKGDKNIRLADEYDSLSINGFMTNYISYDKYLRPGDVALLDVEMMGDALEKNNITDISQIEKAEIEFEITDWDWHDIDKASVKLLGE